MKASIIPGPISEAVQSLGNAIFFGALTTAIGFLALMLAGSQGFTQLGVLTALGIFFAGIFMMTVFFLFLPRRNSRPRNDWMFALVKKYVRWVVRRPASILWISTPALLILAAIALSPKPPIIFDVSTHSMAPKRSDAGYALKTIMEKMPSRWEPVIGIVKAADAQQLHDYWQKVAAQWNELQVAGKIKSFSTPAALALSPARLQANRQKLQATDFAAAHGALEAAIATEGFSRETFDSAFVLLDQLRSAADPSFPCPIGGLSCRKLPAGGF